MSREPQPLSAERWIRRNRVAVRLVAGATAIVALSGTTLLAQQQPGDADKGKARVVERHGPEVDVRANAPGQILVLFPQSTGDHNGVEVTLVESTLPNPPAPGQQPQGPQGPTPTGKEYVFNSRDARDQTVSYRLDANGQPRKLMLLAKLDGKTVEVRPAGGPEGVQVFTVAVPDAPKPPDQPKPEGGDQGNGQPAAPAAPAGPPAQAAVIVLYSGGMAQ